MGITPQELSLLETRPHRTKLWLSIYEPETVFACQVNDASISREARIITYDNVSSGSYLNVENGMVMYVGTSQGDDDKGRIRIKSADASEIEVAENSHINWADNDYLTVVSFFEITAIYPRIIQDPSDPTEVIFYKDYDIAYSDQNTVLGSFVNMGGHFAGFLDPASGETDAYYSSSGTSYVGSTGVSLSYDWHFQGGDPTGSHVHTPGFITYDTPGHYTTSLTVSGSNGALDTSYRHVSIYDRPGEGNNPPVLSWELDTLRGEREGGGYTGRIIIREDIPKETIKDGSLVVIFADDWYGNEKQSIGIGLNRDSIVFAGYIIDGTISYDWREKSVEFEIGSPTEIMKHIEGFSVSVESKGSPSTWFELKDMNVEKALYHYLRWHSTVLQSTDFEFPDDDFKIQYFDSDRESLYSAVNTLMEGTLIGSVVSDRTGKIWSEIDTSALDTPSDYKETSELVLDNDNWRGTPIIEESQTGIVSYLEMGGIAYSGPPGHTSTALLSEAPGSAPNYRGRVERHQGLALDSQSQLNTLCGNVFAHKNARYPLSTYNLAGNYRNWDIAPQKLVPVTIEADDTPRRITFDEKPFTLEEMEFEYDPEQEVLLPSISLTEITSGDVADGITIPVEPPTAGGDTGGGYSVSPLQIPPFPVTQGASFDSSARHHSVSDVPSDDPEFPEFDVSDGDWYGVTLIKVGGSDPDWENGVSLNGDGNWVVGYSGKYYINIVMDNELSESIKIAVSKEDLSNWASANPSRVVADEANAIISCGGVYHFDAGDVVTVLLYNDTGTDDIRGSLEASITLVDTYVGHA